MSWTPLLQGALAGVGLTTTAGLALLRRYLQNELKSPQLVHGDISQEESNKELPLLLQVQLLLQHYWPHPILEFSGYTSTIWTGFVAGLPTRKSGYIEKLTLSDGGTVSLHWATHPRASWSPNVALILPGLNNDSTTTFVQATMQHLTSMGFKAVALNYRGVGDLQLTSARVGCADSWKDLDDVLKYIMSTQSDSVILGVGFSMGAGLLLRYLGQVGERSCIRGAVALAAPVDFPAGGASLESNLRKRVLNFFMVNGVKLFFMQKILKSPYAKHLDRRRIFMAQTLRQMEDATICILHGYKDAWDYYEQNSPRPVLKHISVPTLIINAMDDPVVSCSTLPLSEVKLNRNIYVALTRRGGHIGWGSGGLGAGSWTDSMASQFLKVCVDREVKLKGHSRL